jgi:hypothetical protein
MLQAIPTKHGTGIKLFGDYGDLASLHETFWKLMSESRFISRRERNRLLTVMSYEIRHAYQHDRLCEERSYDAENNVTYYGCYVDWVTLLFSISCLRDNAAYEELNGLDLANLHLLEYWCKEAMFVYDAQGAGMLQHFINARIPTNDDLVYHLHQAVVNEFYRMKPGKARFRKITDLFYKYRWHGECYNQLKAHFDSLTNDGKNTVCDYESNYDDIEVIW